MQAEDSILWPALYYNDFDTTIPSEMTEKRYADLIRDIENYIQILENANLRSQDFFIPDTYKTKASKMSGELVILCFIIKKKH